MAGGMVLLGVLLVYFDVTTGMVLFSIIQLATNGWRAVHYRQFVLWPIFWWYVLGGVLAFAFMRYMPFVPDKAMVYLLLGLMPFMVEALPAAMRPNIEWRGVPFLTGIFTTVIQFLAGVGGLFLDIFFQKSRLDRNTTNATKAGVADLQPCAARRLFRLRLPASATCGSSIGRRRWCWRRSARCWRPTCSSA